MKFDENKQHHYFIDIDLQFFANEDKTEEATPKKREKSREEGQVAKSAEITTALLFVIMFFCLRLLGPHIYTSSNEIFNYSFDLIPGIINNFNNDFMNKLGTFIFTKTIIISLPLLLIAMAIGIVTNLYQVKWKPTTKTLKPKFNKINPLSGFKRMFSMRSVFELIKALLKLVVIFYVIYSDLKERVNVVPLLFDMEIFEGIAYIGNVAVDLGIKVGGYFIFIAAIDYAYQKFTFEKSIKMSKQEVKDEYKNSEGDPQIKGKIRQKMREASMRRMMQDVPQADVIITNPTHLAVALKYDKEKGEAPIVVAKGAGYLAKRIKDVAGENNIQIVENKPVARALYETVDIGNEIPPELYQSVAEILAFVYNLRNGSRAV